MFGNVNLQLTSTFYHNIENKKLCAINGDALDADLFNFSVKGKENYATYVQNYKDCGDFGKGQKLTPIFVLHEDRDNFLKIDR